MGYFTCLLTLGALAVPAFAAIKNDASSVDMARDALLQLEKNLRKDLANQQKWMDIEEREKNLHLINAYKEFGDEMDEQFRDEENYLSSLDNLWLWSRVQDEIWIIDSMYEMFRHMQHKIVELNAIIDVKHMANFVKKIMHHPNAGIPRSLAHIATTIVDEKLFIAAYEVSNRWLRF